MKLPALLRWLGVGVLGASVLTGCSHVRKCHCCDQSNACCSAPIETPPEEQPKKVAETPAPIPAKLMSEKPGNGSIIVAFSGADWETGATRVGTMTLTAEQAAGMGVRPGYTPDALYLQQHPTGDIPNLITKNAPAAPESGQ